MKKRVVLDSSVLVSAFLTPGGTAARLLARSLEGAFSLCLSPEIIDETTHVLLRPKSTARYGRSAEDVADYRAVLTDLAEIFGELPALRAVPLDPKDDMVVATAIKAGADYLVTGDRRHLLVLGAYAGVQIVTPRYFLDLLEAGMG